MNGQVLHGQVLPGRQPVAEGRVGLDFDQLHRFHQAALAEAERRLAAAGEALRRAQAAVTRGQFEVGVLRRILALCPQEQDPLPALPRKGTRTGQGVGGTAGRYLLGVLQATTDGQLTRRRAELACRGWSGGTVEDGLTWLLHQGLAERPERGVYRLTARGRDASPGPLPRLPLRDHPVPAGEDAVDVVPFVAMEG